MAPSSFLAAAAVLSCALLSSLPLAAADFIIKSDIDQFNRLADENRGFPHQTFRSSPIVAPIFHVNVLDESLIDPSLYLFIGAAYGKVGGRAGPMIFDPTDLSLIYADQNWNSNFNCEVQTIHGVPHLTYWADNVCHVVDQNYNLKYDFNSVNGHFIDMHELSVTDAGTGILTTWKPIDFNCSLWGGPEQCRVHDTGFQEVDLETGKEIFGWMASHHMAPEDTFARWEADNFNLDKNAAGTFDAYHMNSVAKTAEGNYLVSSRHYGTVQLISGEDGVPLWTLGGKKNDFKDLSGGKATNIGWQHDARFYHNYSHITMFDNHGEVQGDCGDHCESRGLHLELDFDAMTARVVQEFYHPEHQNSQAMGGLQKLESGNVITGWGWTPSYVEWAPDGRVAMDIQRGRTGEGRQSDMFAYRVFKAAWTGRPAWPPSLALDHPSEEGGKATVFMSWNGATDIKSWAVYSSDDSSPSQISHRSNHIAEIPRSGFETSVDVDPGKLRKYLVVAALDKNGRMMGISGSFNVETSEVDESGSKGADPVIIGPSNSMSFAGPRLIVGVVSVATTLAIGAFFLYRRKKGTTASVIAKYIRVPGAEA